MEFKIGDTVMLKSGGPLMTVSNIVSESYLQYSKGDISCIWFDKNNQMSGSFNPLVLSKED